MGRHEQFIRHYFFTGIINSKILASAINFHIIGQMEKVIAIYFLSYKIGNILKAGCERMSINNHDLKIITCCRISLSMPG